MSMSRESSLTNSGRFFQIKIDSYERENLCGCVYHNSMNDEEAVFESFLMMVKIIERCMNFINYPAENMRVRKFNEKNEDKSIAAICRMRNRTETAGTEGKQSMDMIIKHRYYVSWQGDVMFSDKKNWIPFKSLLEFMEIIVSNMENVKYSFLMTDYDQMEKDIYFIKLYRNENTGLKGSIYTGAGIMPVKFESDIQLVKQILRLSKKNMVQKEDPGQELKENLIGKDILNLVILFQKNHSWQGFVYWTDKRKVMGFRSLMELLLLLEEISGK